ncbi:hypothetical protein BGZ96_002894 [Linnemannia gamsii]|uniref:HCP-like protein n=1 Tax=Linnemannia gamsii TaxID=64522 RepID=A0ABQ7JK86_9FUNG|nr:hypothetical protein BGZ96_002894 [Linnemannia gamsii]
MLQAGATLEHIQGFRPVHKSQHPSAVSAPLDSPDVTHIDCYIDPETKKDFILWEDIQQVYEEALFVRYKTKFIPFLKGTDFRSIEPRRIAPVPGVILDIVVGGELGAVNASSLQHTVQNLSLHTPQLSLPSVQRNPTYGLMEEAFKNHSHIDLLAAFIAAAGAQTSLSQGSPVKSTRDRQSNDDTTTTLPCGETTRRTNAPKNSDTTITKELLETLVSAANQGDPKAQIALGDRYRKGEGVNQNRRAAMDWYCMVSSWNPEHARAEYNIGLLYLRNDNLESYLKPRNIFNEEYHKYQERDDDEDKSDIPRNHIMALEWIVKAADQGLADAQFAVAVTIYNECYFYLLGQIDPESASSAVGWMLKAANQGHAGAQYLLGASYKNELFYLPVDIAVATDWLMKAVDQGYLEAQRQLESIYCNYSSNDDDPDDPDDITKALSKIKAWIFKAADQGVARAQFCMGFMYRYGDDGTPQNDFKAFEWTLRAAEQGHTEGQMEIATCYEDGRGVVMDPKKALEWYVRAEQLGHPGAEHDVQRLQDE